jgi:hypothetical protein
MNNPFNLPEIDSETFLSLSRFFIRIGKPLFIFGEPGIGKTQIPIQAIKECGYKISIINLASLDRCDLGGFPSNLNSADETIKYKFPYFLPPLNPGEKADTVLLFDEVDKCPSEITQPLLSILDQKSINGRAINIVSSILTGNLITDRTFSNSLSSALLDRGAKFLLRFDFEKWLSWARSKQIHELILGFLISHPEFACSNENNKNRDDFMASPSPRGWTLASEALHQAKDIGKITDNETLCQIVSGFVGLDAGIQFSVYFNYFRRFEPAANALLQSGSLTSLNFSSLSPTERLVFCISTAHLAKQRMIRESKKKPSYSAINHLCSFLKDNVEPEIQGMILNNSFPIEVVTDNRFKLYNCASFFELTSKLGEK